MLPPTGDIERIANSAFRITFHKPYKNMADSNFTAFSPFFVWLKP